MAALLVIEHLRLVARVELQNLGLVGVQFLQLVPELFNKDHRLVDEGAGLVELAHVGPVRFQVTPKLLVVSRRFNDVLLELPQGCVICEFGHYIHRTATTFSDIVIVLALLEGAEDDELLLK